MSYIENLLGNPVLPEVQESLGLAAGNYKIKGFNIFILGSYAILDSGLALVDGLRIVSSANLQIPTAAVLGRYVFLRIRTYTEVIDGNTSVQDELSLVAQFNNIPTYNDDLSDGVGTKDVLLAFVNSSGVVNLSTPGALAYYDVPSRLLDLENDIKVGQAKGYWASYFDTTDQRSDGVVKPVEYNMTYFQYGISCVDKTKITFNQKGTFNIQFSFEVENETPHEQIAELWFRVNGTDLANTNTRITLLKQAHSVPSWNFVIDANVGDFLQIMWYAPTGVVLKTYAAETSPSRPLVPSAIVTVTQILYNQKSVPPGGTAGQVLAKIDNTDYNTQWVTKDTDSLGTRLTNVETKNTTQDTRLDKLENYKILWTGASYMNATQSITIESMQLQNAGIVLVFSAYVNGEAANNTWHYFFVPKYHGVLNSGGGLGFVLRNTTVSGDIFTSKYLYIRNTRIDGHDSNVGGNHSNFVLRYVIGV